MGTTPSNLKRVLKCELVLAKILESLKFSLLPMLNLTSANMFHLTCSMVSFVFLFFVLFLFFLFFFLFFCFVKWIQLLRNCQIWRKKDVTFPKKFKAQSLFFGKKNSKIVSVPQENRHPGEILSFFSLHTLKKINLYLKWNLRLFEFFWSFKHPNVNC